MYWSGMSLAAVVAWSLLFTTAWATPTALSVTPSTTFYGDDGSWSAISIRVGSPQQWVDVLVSTGSSETWVVSPHGCDGSTTCATKRGGLFNFTKSTTWQPEGPFELGLDLQLGFDGAADYGLDILEFGTTGLSIKDSIIGAINTTEYWAGFFGVGIVPGNFTHSTALSPISNLVEKAGLISSHSYGYTAGASYQQKGEPCSLTLGGYDANRFIPHNVSFELNPKQQPQAFLDSAYVSIPQGSTGSLASNPLPLLDRAQGISVLIDSSTPFMWLPKSLCEKFQEALGLSYNDTLDLYTFDSNISRHDDLRNWDLSFTFSLADNSTSSEIVNITLPYSAFDLQLSFPYIENTTYGSDEANKYYFPLRQASNDTQYTIGRSFLQEAYLIVDYERNNFSVHQAIHTENPLGNTNIINILRPSTSNFTPPKVSKSLSKGAIVGIAVGAVALFVFLALLLWFICKKHRYSPTESEEGSPTIGPRTPGSKSQYTVERSEPLSPTSMATEVDSIANQRHEMYAPIPDPSELDAGSATVPRTIRDGTEKVKFSTYQQALWREHRRSPLAAGSSLPPAEDFLSPSGSRPTTSNSNVTQATPPPILPPVQSAAEFMQRMIERKKANAESEDPQRTLGIREKEKKPVRYAEEVDTYVPGDNDAHVHDEDIIMAVEENVDSEREINPQAEQEVQPQHTKDESRTSRSDSITKTPLSPKVLLLGRHSFMRGRRKEGMPG